MNMTEHSGMNMTEHSGMNMTTTIFKTKVTAEDTADMYMGAVTVFARDVDGWSNWREVHEFSICSWAATSEDHDEDTAKARAAAWIAKAESSGKSAVEMHKEWVG